MVLPLFSGRFARSSAAFNAAPEEIPTRMPSDLANVRPSAKASSLSSPKSVPDTKRLGNAAHPTALCLGASSQSALGVRLGGVSGEQSGIKALPVYLEYLIL